MWKSLFVLLGFSVGAIAAIHPGYEQDLIQQAKAKQLASQAQWLKLLHYKKGWSGNYHSEADGDAFFLAKEGKDNPQAELIANLNAFFLNAPEKDVNESAQCKFPARYQWLKEQLRFDDSHLSPKSCPKYLEFRDSIAAKSASIVFSSYYLNNPASAFGHSLLRLNRTETASEGKRYELLDNGINYAAVVTQDNPILYAFYGVMGFFKGTFTRIPYYYKVREYNDFESRDLWVYDLNLTQKQVDRLVAHIWELGSTHFDYYYLTENCSYHILTALEVALPELDLSDRLPLVVVPADTIKVISQTPGLVARVQYRPSVRSQFLARVNPMPREQISLLKTLVATRDLTTIPPSLTDEEKATVLDAAIDHLDFKHFRTLVEEPEGIDAEWKQKLLVSRSRIALRSPDLSVTTPVDETPHIGHEIMRAGVDGGASSTLGGFGTVHFRFALHDLLDPKTGYPEYSQIEFFNTRIRYLPEDNRVWLEDFALFRVVSLSPLTEFDRQLSWKVKVGGSTIRDNTCDHCFAGQIEVGGGPAIDLAKHVTAFLSVDGEGMLTTGFSPRSILRPGAGPSLLVRARFTQGLVTLFQGSYRYRLFTDLPHYGSASAELRWAATRDFALNLKSAVFPDGWETTAGLYYYF